MTGCGRSRAARRAAVAAVLVGLALGGSPAVAQDGSLEDALGDRLEVRRDGSRGAPGTGDGTVDDDGAGGDGSGEDVVGNGADGSSDGAVGDAGGSGDGDGSGATVDDGGDPSTSERDGTTSDGEGTGPGGSADDADDALDLDDPAAEVEGEGRGPGELAAGGEDRTAPLTVAVVALLASTGALVAVQRRYGPTTS